MTDSKGALKSITLELRRELEGRHDATGDWQPGDLERCLAAIGVRRDRAPVPVDELPHLSANDREARTVVEAFVRSHAEAGGSREAALAEFVRESAYTWANRLLALRCMEARGLIDEVILQKEVYGGRSLQHQRLARREPERCSGEDEGLLAVLFDEFARRGKELPLLFDPKAPEVALRPSVAGLKRCIALLSGTVTTNGQEPAPDTVFSAADALGWAYQYWNTEEKSRVFEKVRTKKGAKIEGAEIIPATCIYTEPYMVKFLVQNSLGAMWMGINPGTRLCDTWQYYVRDADRRLVPKKAVSDITFLDPACGSGHFLIEAFDLFYAMYVEEGLITEPQEICASILERNLHGIDIDERAVQIAALALVMKAKEKAPDFVPRRVNLVATNIRLPVTKEHLDAFLLKHPEDEQLRPALVAVFEGLAHANELGSLLQLEEPVEKELRALRTTYEASGSPWEQQTILTEERLPIQGKLPIGVATYEEWKERALARIREHFDADAGGSDLGALFFGEAAGKGLSLVDLVARRYDVVAANPPYMGSRNMGAVLKKHIEQHFRPGKRDISAAFILRCLELAGPNGRVAMVAQQSWMFLRSYADLRALDDVKRKKSPRAFRGVLKVTSLEVVAHLGEHAFHDSSAAGAFVAMFVTARTEPAAEHRLTALRLVGPKNPEEKDRLLQRAVRPPPAQTQAQSDPKTDTRALHAVVSQPLQARFLTIPQAPLCYWLREGALAALNQAAPPGFALVVSEGLGTRRDERFVRFVWEVTDHDRWWVYSKGGGYGRWFGHDMWSVDWAQSGARVRSYISEHYPPEKFTLLVRNESRFGTARLVYSTAARGSLGAREIDGAIPGDKGPGLFLKGANQSAVLALLNCRGSSYLLRGLTAGGINFNGFYVGSLPVWLATNQNLEEGAATCVSLVRWMVSRDPTERSFGNALSSGELSADVTLQARFICAENRKDAVAAMLHEAEGQCEQGAFAAYGIADGDLEAILEETGTPAGWFPLIAGYDAAPELPRALKVRLDLDSFSQRPRRRLSTSELSDLKRRLRALYEGGSGAKDEEDEPADEEEGEKDESEAATCGARMPIPAATFLEELSQKLEIHPVSTYCLLRELRENEGVVCKPELMDFVEGCLEILVLRLLGHRWPQEVDGAMPLPTWADSDGVIPLTDGAGEATLIGRVRERFAEEFGGGHVAAVEREFEEIIGKPLGTWLASDFFKRHASRFRKRPIVWQLTSRPTGAESPRGRGAVRPAIPFACLIYYHRLDGDTVPKLRSQYIGPLRTRLQTELVGLEKLKQRTPDQDARRVEVDADIEAIRAFDARLEDVVVSGFDSDDLEVILVEEPLDQWTSRDGRAVAPASRDAFRLQERRYEPDLNDGVRVNIAPLQRAGLLAADVLAAKDVEKAIADRAEWRSDERRWCREGKLSRPGWWTTAAEEMKS